MDHDLAKKHYETSDLRIHIEMCKDWEKGRHKERVLRRKKFVREAK
jgi:hypothetical protein